MKMEKPVLIVGAGPTGMTAAMELSRFGVPVRLVDKLLEPSTTSRALAVQARTLELFQQRGLSREMLRIGNRGNATVLYGDGKCLGKVQLSRIKSRYNYILLVPQSETERVLREQLARQNVPIERGTEMIAFAQTGSPSQPEAGGIRAMLRDRAGTLEELEASYLISAEGAHSSARHTLALEFEGKAVGESYALADLYLDGDLPDDALSIFLGAHGFLAVFPMGNRHFRLIATDPRRHAQGDAEPALEELQQLYNETAHIPAHLRDLTWSSRFRINSRMLRRFQAGRVFFGGDAAHVHSPAGGQGMNTGIQDMIDLSWKLALVWQGKAAPALLDTYQEDRLPVIRGVVTKSEAATNAFNLDNLAVHELITHLAPVLLNKQFVQNLSTEMISEVAVNYRASSLSHTAHAHGGLKAGDRLPDLDVSAGAGSAALYTLLDPSRFTLLMTNGAEASGPAQSARESLAPWNSLVQTHQIMPPADQPEAKALFKEHFGSQPGLFLVRPDAYLGFAGGGADLAGLMQWLNRWLPQQSNNND